MLPKLLKSIAVFSLIVVFASIPMLAAHAASLHQAAPPADDFANVFDTLKNMAGVATLIAALVNLGKKIKLPNGSPLVEDGSAPTWSAGLNIIALIGIIVIKAQGWIDLLPLVDTQAGNLANVLTVVVAYFAQVFATRKVHDLILAGIPGVGHSYSGRVAGEATVIDVMMPKS